MTVRNGKAFIDSVKAVIHSSATLTNIDKLTIYDAVLHETL